MAAVGAVAVGAGMLPRWSGRITRGEVTLLAGYGVGAAYLFGLVMNLWFWPIAVGPDTSISLDEGGSFAENLTRFLVFSLSTSTLTWDTVRAIVTAVGIVLLARPLLGAIRRVYHPQT
jgi:energy-coupling factor transport system substrate-specific component